MYVYKAVHYYFLFVDYYCRITVHGLFILIAARRRLDPDCHEVRINHGKYKAAVKPTLTVSSLNIDEVYIVKIPRRTYAEGTVSIIASFHGMYYCFVTPCFYIFIDIAIYIIVLLCHCLALCRSTIYFN